MENKKEAMPRACVGAFIYNEKDEIFMMRSTKWNKQYVIPGGGIKFGESLTKALKREVKEETGMDIDEIIFLNVYDGAQLGKAYTGRFEHLVLLNYKARQEGSAKIKLNKEGISYKWQTAEDWLNEKDINENIKEMLVNSILFETQSEYYQKYKRALADYHNLQKQTSKERGDFIRFANEQLLYKIIPVYDNLKISVDHDNKDNTDAWFEGVKYVVKQFKAILDEIGVEEIETVGKKFDHHTMEAVEGQGEMVEKEVKPGYKLNGKVIIPAKVIVGGKK